MLGSGSFSMGLCKTHRRHQERRLRVGWKSGTSFTELDSVNSVNWTGHRYCRALRGSSAETGARYSVHRGSCIRICPSVLRHPSCPGAPWAPLFILRSVLLWKIKCMVTTKCNSPATRWGVEHFSLPQQSGQQFILMETHTYSGYTFVCPAGNRLMEPSFSNVWRSLPFCPTLHRH